MALIEKRAQGKWRARIRKKGYREQSRTFDTKAKAERWARKIESEMDDGVFVSRAEAERTTFKQLMTRYREEITIKKKGADVEESRIKMITRHPLFDRFLATISNSDIASYRDERLKSVSAGTVLKELTLMGHAIDIGIKEWGIYLPSNPVKLISRPKAAKARDRRFKEGEEKKLYDSIETHTRNTWVKPIVQIAVETAMRRGEILGLKWEHTNLKEKFVHLVDTKNGESRDVPLSSEAIKILSGLPRDLKGKVFPISANSLQKAFERAVKKAELENIRFHDLRHEATSRLFEKGLNIMEVAAITGHKDLQMLKRYTHLKAEDLAKKLG